MAGLFSKIAVCSEKKCLSVVKKIISFGELKHSPGRHNHIRKLPAFCQEGLMVSVFFTKTSNKTHCEYKRASLKKVVAFVSSDYKKVSL